MSFFNCFLHISMACKLKIWFMVCISITLMVANLGPLARALPQVPCYFIFGDSLFDNGNNNVLNSSNKVNYPPYGVDFPEGPTGRFGNGRNIPDFIAENLGFDHHIPPFATTAGRDILTGVNYASGGSGIRDETGQHSGGSIWLNKQLQNHQVTMSRITTLLGSKESAGEHLRKCLYSVGIGSNDYLNNYLMPQFYPTSKDYTPAQYATALMNQYNQQLRTLYNNGARKIALFGLPHLGCIPRMKALYPTTKFSCVASVEYHVPLFNNGLKLLVDELNKNLTDAKFIIVDLAGISSIEWPLIGGGITITGPPCCKLQSDGLCVPNSVPCHHRALNIFFDAFHPSEIANLVVGARAYHSLLPGNTYPMDIYHLVHLQLK